MHKVAAGCYASAADYASVWVDWNNDTTFQIDSEEEIYLINDGGANEVFYGNIEVP